MTASLLDRIDEAIALGAPALALALLRQHYATRPTLSTASGVIERVGRLGRAAGLAPCKLFVLRSFTVEPVVPLLRAQAMLHGIDLEVAVGEFNAYPQEVLDPGSALHAFAPDVVLFALQTRDLVPALWSGGGPEAGAAVDRALGDLGAWVERLRAGSRAQILALSFCPPVWSSAGLLDAQAADGQAALIGRLNHGLRGIAAAVPGTTVVDYEGLVARHGRQRWHDERKWLTARMPIAADCLAPFADELVRALVALRGKTRKAMVVDLDNTLWGGVVGEDGPQGIALGAEYPGAAFQALQRALKDLVDRGILLAIASKNNEADAREVLSDHPGMVLRPTDFAATRINWNDKAGSLRELAAELNIGLDSLVFLDDNPVERERVRAEVPEVAVLDLPEDPMQFAAVVRGCLWFDRATLTDEDRARTRQYAQQRERAALESSAGSVEEFLASLEMSMIAARPSAQTVARVAQLTQKTNQFNTTTRRRTDEEVRALVEAPGSEVWQYAVRDRFGDNGIVGVGILSVDGTRAELDTFLMSCRVIGRTVETAMLSHLAARARDRGAGELRGWFHPTRKNAPAAGFFAGHGFREAERAGDSVCWALELAAAPAVPRWISLVTEGN